MRDRTPGEWLLYGQVATINWAQETGVRVRNRIKRLFREEGGQTPTEYLMIVGLMAAVIVLVFVTFYWTNVRTAAKTWVTKVQQSILGTKIN
ncbi:MAG: hypothetical protein KJ066_16980 [Acidobacteria bacterium]|nr:hypothetical protein [Acidobacteriota bacterium]